MTEAKPRRRMRRIELSAHDLDQIETLAGLGLADEYIAAVLSTQDRPLSLRTFSSMKSSNRQGVADRITRGRALGAYQISRSLFQMAVSGQSLGAIKYYEATRLGIYENPAMAAAAKDEEENNEVTAPVVNVYLPDNGRGDSGLEPINVEAVPVDK